LGKQTEIRYVFYTTWRCRIKTSQVNLLITGMCLRTLHVMITTIYLFNKHRNFHFEAKNVNIGMIYACDQCTVEKISLRESGICKIRIQSTLFFKCGIYTFLHFYYTSWILDHFTLHIELTWEKFMHGFLYCFTTHECNVDVRLESFFWKCKRCDW
jgi:hypothetical protein